jgi:hypothetical protein
MKPSVQAAAGLIATILLVCILTEFSGKLDMQFRLDGIKIRYEGVKKVPPLEPKSLSQIAKPPQTARRLK